MRVWSTFKCLRDGLAALEWTVHLRARIDHIDGDTYSALHTALPRSWSAPSQVAEPGQTCAGAIRVYLNIILKLWQTCYAGSSATLHTEIR